MTRPAFLVFVSVRVLAVAAALLALAAILVSCGDAEEDLGPSTGFPSTTGSPSSPDLAITSTPKPLKDYSDTARGFSLSYPADLEVKEESFELSGKEGTSPITQRVLTFSSPSGLPGMRIGVAPNPSSLSLKDWVSTYPGWPSEPSEQVIAGESALVFPVNQMGEANPVIYLEHGGYVYGFTRFPSTAEIGGIPTAILSEADYKAALGSLQLSP